MSPLHPDKKPLLTARGLAFSRNETRIFGPLDFDVAAGEALLVQGDNGAGKTSLLRVLAGLLRADHGHVDRHPGPDGKSALGSDAAYLGHLPALKADLTVAENLEFLGGLHGTNAMRQDDALDRVGLCGFGHVLARQVSAGQRKRLSLARLLLSPAPLWLLDEPYANLDLAGIDLVNRMVQAHLGDGGAAIVTTHGAYAAPPVRTRLLQMGEGPRLADALLASVAVPNARTWMAGPARPESR